eukprot:gene2484-4836_t
MSLKQRSLFIFALKFCHSFAFHGELTRRPMTTLNARVKIEDVLKTPQWPEKWPFTPADFVRQDESTDAFFYDQPRLVYHIDDAAVGALTRYYKSVFFEGADVLDICSSWVSHFPTDIKLGKRVGLGMNKFELSKNVQLTDYIDKDLNVDPIFPLPDNSFDFVTCVVSVDYLTRPLEVFSEIRRVLKPGGRAIISQSNRCFPTKAINIWLNTNDLQHVFIIGSYFHYAGGFNPPESFDISPFPGFSDPLYIIKGTKKSS